MIERDWLKPGDTVADPFGGVGLGAADALANGINWVGCELESRFVAMGAGCECVGISKADWARFYGRWGKLKNVCPCCIAQAGQVTDIDPQLSLFDSEPSAAYVRNSGQIPYTEPHYYAGNLDRFRRYARGGAWAKLVQGDSRNLSQVVGQVCGVVSSPPFSPGQSTGGDVPSFMDGKKRSDNGIGHNYGHAAGQLANLPQGDLSAVITSPPFAGNSGGRGEASRNGIDAALFDRHSGGMIGGTGDDPANLAHLPMKGIEAVISSPPYSNGEKGHPSLGSVNKDDWGKDGRDIAGRRGKDGNYGASSGQLANLPQGNLDGVISSPPYSSGCAHTGGDDPKPDRIQGGKRGVYGVENGYGESNGQLGAMPEGQPVSAVITSPPFESSLNDGLRDTDREKYQELARCGRGVGTSYGSTEGQLGQGSGETFWTAARQIVTECHKILKPGGVSVWVTKRFVRGGQIVEFSDQWIQLCESVGFEFIERHRAMLVKGKGRQVTLDGEEIELKVERKSFFRRLYEKKRPDLSIDYEDVLILRKRV